MMLVAGCVQDQKPPDVLSEEEMVAILMDVYITEEKANRAFSRPDSIKKIFPELKAKIFERAGIQDSAFRKSLEYYIANPKKLDHIFAALVDSLSLKSQAAPIP